MGAIKQFYRNVQDGLARYGTGCECARVSANALVMIDSPEGMPAIGNPARIVHALLADMILEWNEARAA